jgi:hypothetical protein
MAATGGISRDGTNFDFSNTPAQNAQQPRKIPGPDGNTKPLPPVPLHDKTPTPATQTPPSEIPKTQPKQSDQQFRSDMVEILFALKDKDNDRPHLENAVKRAIIHDLGLKDSNPTYPLDKDIVRASKDIADFFPNNDGVADAIETFRVESVIKNTDQLRNNNKYLEMSEQDREAAPGVRNILSNAYDYVTTPSASGSNIVSSQTSSIALDKLHFLLVGLQHAAGSSTLNLVQLDVMATCARHGMPPLNTDKRYSSNTANTIRILKDLLNKDTEITKKNPSTYKAVNELLRLYWNKVSPGIPY